MMVRANGNQPGERSPVAGRRVAGMAWMVVGLVLASGVVGGLWRGLNERPNWGSLQRESRYVWQHGRSAADTAMFGYLPTAVFALWPFMVWPPQPLGLTLYVGANVLAAVGSIWIVYRWWGPGDRPAASFAWPVLVVSANFQHVIQANQLTLWALLLCVGGLTLIGRRRPLAGGLLLGLAGLVKVMPFVLTGYLLVRRQWRALIGVAAAIILFDVLPCVVFFGWRGSLDEHRAWLRRAEWHSNRRQIEDPLLIGVYRHTSNFSYASVLARWLRGLPEAKWQVVVAGQPPAGLVQRCRAELGPDECLTLAPMPPRDRPWAVHRIRLDGVPRFHLAELSARTVWWVWAATLTVGLGALAWATWRTGLKTASNDWPAASALWMLAMLWLSPMMRHYYLALAFPAVAVVWHALVEQLQGRHGRWTAGAVLGAAALAAWLIGVACLGWDVGRWYGIHLAVVAVLVGATVWAWRRGRERGRQVWAGPSEVS